MSTSVSYLMTATGACLASALLAVTLSARTTPFAMPAQQTGQSAADDPQAELFAQTCNRCHDGARITAVRRTRDEWQDVITKMIERGAMGTEDDFQNVFGYLRRHYGKVYINTATADEITTSLALPAKDADAILAYRKAHGAFQDFDAVRKVPEIDVKTLDDHKDAVAF
jgi:competence ComEA-like helix-hairpin-helix protein